MRRRNNNYFNKWSFLVVLMFGLQACGENSALDGNEEFLAGSPTIAQLQAKMQTGELTAVALVEFYLQRIEREDTKYRAIIVTNPKAIELARELDAERSIERVRGPLHGIPVVVKDNIETVDMATTAGSLALKDNFTNRDAALVKNLKAAGAIIIAKTNLSEWANFRSTRSSSGWSAVGGQTRNPVDTSRSACGSSAGTAAAVIANLAVAGVGTETDGSISCPSAATGIVGLKPTVGLVSRSGIVPIAHTQDTAGPMAKSVADAAIMLAAMQGSDPMDAATQRSGFDFNQTYPVTEPPVSLAGVRIGLLKSRVKPHEGVDAVYESALALLTVAGAVLIEDLKNERYETFGDDIFTVLLFEFKNDLNQYLSTLPSPFNELTLEKLIAFNEANADQEMPFFKQEIFEAAQAKGPLTDPEYLDALARLRKATTTDGLDKLYADNDLDLLITPSLGPAWSIDLINGGSYTGGYSSYSAISGYPYLTIPMGKLHHLPLGVSLIGLQHEETKILQMAQSFEAIFATEN